ncbi:MAG: DUF1622 domain-containing protein [Pyrinomonadaceae bacterium MAG19_C2-C3]|nr:DUF1622 domain-containing protein [Pyrinomonadaceae bacterium MAG19_C2-C3]
MRILLGLIQETAGGLIRAPSDVGAEDTIVNLVLWLKLAVETMGAIIIGIGVVAAASVFIASRRTSRLEGYNRIRLTLSRFLALALEFQLGADILSTAIAPSWEQIGKLAAIAFIRTALNYFLAHEMKEERAEIDADTKPTGGTRRDVSSSHTEQANSVVT